MTSTLARALPALVRRSRLAVPCRRSERGFEPPDDWDLFTIDIDSLTVISVEGGQLVIDGWSTTAGRQTMRRA